MPFMTSLAYYIITPDRLETSTLSLPTFCRVENSPALQGQNARAERLCEPNPAVLPVLRCFRQQMKNFEGGCQRLSEDNVAWLVFNCCVTCLFIHHIHRCIHHYYLLRDINEHGRDKRSESMPRMCSQSWAT